MATQDFSGASFDFKPPSSMAQFLEQRHEQKLSHITHRYTIHENLFEVMASKFSEDSTFLAVSYADKSLSLYSSLMGDPLYLIKDAELTAPITGISWKPSGRDYSEVQQFKAVTGDGRICMWRQKNMNTLKTLLVSEDNQYSCLDHSQADNGKKLAIAGKQPVVEIYDEATLERVCDLKTSNAKGGHTNRIFSVKFDPVMPHIVYSGGWDCVVNIWDIRSGKASGYIHGPQIVGEAIDIKEETRVMLTGSYQVKDGLQLWDLRTYQLLQQINWHGTMPTVVPPSDETTLFYSARFANPKKEFIVAGGANKNQVRVFGADSGKLISIFEGMQKPCLTTDTSSDGSLLAIGSADGSLSIKNFVYI